LLDHVVSPVLQRMQAKEHNPSDQGDADLYTSTTPKNVPNEHVIVKLELAGFHPSRRWPAAK